MKNGKDQGGKDTNVVNLRDARAAVFCGATERNFRRNERPEIAADDGSGRVAV